MSGMADVLRRAPDLIRGHAGGRREVQALRPARAVLALLCLAGPATGLAAEDELAVPSGMPVTLHEMFWDDQGNGPVYRFRFLAPEIGGESPVAYEEVAADMDALCQGFAAPRLDGAEPAPSRIVISLMAEPVEYGDPSPGIRQYFEAYSLQGGLCIWEAF